MQIKLHNSKTDGIKIVKMENNMEKNLLMMKNRYEIYN
jgi:hypothetical protein